MHRVGSPRADTCTLIGHKVAEWDYGEYEGLLSSEIAVRAGANWNIWVDGCA